MIARGLAAFVFLWFWAVCAGAQTLAQVNQQVLEAFQVGDLERAIELTEQAVAVDPVTARAQPVDYLLSLNNLSFLLGTAGAAPTEVLTAAERALRFADETRQVGSANGLNALINAAQANAVQGNVRRSKALRDQLLREIRGTSWHGQVIPSAVDLAFMNGDVTALPLLIEEMIAVAGRYAAQTTIAQLYEVQQDLEAQGDIAGVSALIDARVLIARDVAPDVADQFAHAALSQKYFMHYEAGQYARAAVALREWAATGLLSDAEMAFLETQADGGLLLAQGQAFGADRGAALGFAELTLAYAQLAFPPEDHRIGLAFRERAFALGSIGNFEQAAIDLQNAVAVLTRSDDGQAFVHLVLDDLASNAAQRGALEQAHLLYEQADAAYEEALARGAAPLSAFDQSIAGLNRAQVALGRGAVEAAHDLMMQAAQQFDRHLESGSAKPNDQWHRVQLAQTQALITAEKGSDDVALRDTLEIVSTANRHFPRTHPGRATALTNAADQLLVLGERGQAIDLLKEALSLAEEGLPPNAPFRADMHLKLALAAITGNDLEAALGHLNAAADVHRAPENRRILKGTADTFELLAWALLSRQGGGRADVDAALAALQWTHTTKSAEAYAMMATRLAADDPRVATLIKNRQDVMSALDGNQSRLSLAFARGENPEGPLAERSNLQQALAEADAALAEADLVLTGQAPIVPLTLADIQSRLAADEVLVTFLLPGLNPSVSTAIERSSNIALAIRRDGYRIAVIPENSRGALNRRIDAFRCLMAISDPGCGAQDLAVLRGAMDLGADAADAPSADWSVAHALYEDLFSGVAPLFREGDQLVLVPPADLLRLPYQALLTDAPPADGRLPDRWLIRAHAVSVLPSMAAFDALKRQEPSLAERGKFLGIGDPEIGNAPDIDCARMSLTALRSAPAVAGGLFARQRADGLRLADVRQIRAMSRLPDATCELQAIAAAFGQGKSALRTRAAASETEVKRLNASGELSQFELLVFATHGVVAGETSAVAPGLVLTPPPVASADDDGLLTAAEVATLSLAARLVILSACNTAAGSDATEEGLSGLASGFFHAGAQSVLVTHWAVFSDASATISARLSIAMVRNSEGSIARELQEVVLGVLDDPTAPPRTKHPSFWAPFTLVGL